MKNPFRHIKSSLSTRLSLWIVLFAALIFLIALGFMFNQSRKAIRQEAINHATQILDNTAERVNTILTKVLTIPTGSQPDIWMLPTRCLFIVIVSLSTIRN